MAAVVDDYIAGLYAEVSTTAPAPREPLTFAALVRVARDVIDAQEVAGGASREWISLGLWLTADETELLRGACTHPAEASPGHPGQHADRLFGVDIHPAGCDACSTITPAFLLPGCSCTDDCRSPRCGAPARAAETERVWRAMRMQLRSQYAGPAFWALPPSEPRDAFRVTHTGA
ncbi:hypothetical protein [Dactylosporangium sp. CS-033363]|uniref:hypothetical protein n=1 Tax=Dactylosporangium sp. CS-033363 TaxID=3239935 RepID=UPI003D8E365C